ncbi:hypothetical protein [Pseudomonas fluorescens]|uniref:Lipoprotein n=1 Tax=Pseudomonas fluorescens TaxID=294 RepID=A0A5E7FWD6_PSEFL|nr:hypothetical protein [Pseudomonas fluorescens]VVO44021.1 hypothetical protein PS723_06283 [Pseudomonas fluorescens]
MNLKILSYTVIALVLSGCVSSGGAPTKPVPPSAKALNDAQIRNALIGNKLNNVQKPTSMSFNADGTEIFQRSGAKPQTLYWTVNDGVLCFAATGLRTECYRVKADNKDYWFVEPDSGKPRYQYTLTPQ